MSSVIKCQADPVALRPIIIAWLEEAKVNDVGLNIDIDSSIEQLRDMWKSPDSDILLLVIKQKIVGFMCMMAFKNQLVNKKIANEYYLYVLPDYRKGRNPRTLIRAAKEWAKEHECSHVVFSVSRLASELHDKVCRLYNRIGFKHLETVYIDEVA